MTAGRLDMSGLDRIRNGQPGKGAITKDHNRNMEPLLLFPQRNHHNGKQDPRESHQAVDGANISPKWGLDHGGDGAQNVPRIQPRAPRCAYFQDVGKYMSGSKYPEEVIGPQRISGIRPAWATLRQAHGGGRGALKKRDQTNDQHKTNQTGTDQKR